MDKKGMTRRTFFFGAAMMAAGCATARPVKRKVSPNEKLNIGCVGVKGMQGASDVKNVSSENIYALCDVDEKHLLATAANYPGAQKYRDFRVMLDKEYKNLDAITITIPDHMHATVALWAMERGLAVHCQKPLTQTVWEARLLRKAAEKYNVVTQMGNQGYSSEATRLACEIMWDGQLGDITEVHSFNGGGFARDITQWPAIEEVPATVDWDLWTGRAAKHPYSSKIHPINWRGFLDYGTQMVGDWGIHQFGPANWGLQLGSPTSIECMAVEGVNPVTYPSYCCKLEFPERPNRYIPAGKMPPVTVYWYEGKSASLFKLPEALTPQDMKGYNELFIGSKGFMATGERGESVRLVPEAKMKEFKKPPQILKRSPGHFQDWIRACKGGEAPCSNFSIAGPYVEWLLLGTICWRFPNEKLLWDSANLRFTNNEKANEYIKPKFRKGWELKEIK